MERKLLTCFTLVAGVVLVVGCVTTVPTMATPTSSPNLDPVPDSAIQRPQTPIISDALRRGCRDDGKQGDFQNSGLPQGEAAVDFTLRNTEGNPFTLSELLNEKPVMMVFGSFTWPPFRRSCAAINDLYAKYSDRAHIIILYTVEAHAADSSWPAAYSVDEKGNPINQPKIYEERLKLARKTILDQEIDTVVLVDEIDNPVWCTYGPAPNIAYLIGKDGKIVAKQGWFDGVRMEMSILAYFEER